MEKEGEKVEEEEKVEGRRANIGRCKGKRRKSRRQKKRKSGRRRHRSRETRRRKRSRSRRDVAAPPLLVVVVVKCDPRDHLASLIQMVINLRGS